MPDNVRDALLGLKSKGVRVVVASGRPVDFIDNTGDFPFDAWIGCNGGQVFDADKNLIFSSPIEREQAVKVAEIATRLEIPTYTFGAMDSGINCMNDESTYMRGVLNIKLPPFRDIVEFCRNNDVYEFTTFVSREREAELYRPVLRNVDYIRWHDLFTDINPSGVDKGIALCALMKHWGFSPEEAMAFGDGGNDIPMLRAAGKGVAMGGCRDDVAAAADFTAPSVDEDGIGVALRHFGLL